jgi:hypothetical protein
MRIVIIFKILDNKKIKVTNNKLANISAGLVTNGLKSDVAQAASLTMFF